MGNLKTINSNQAFLAMRSTLRVLLAEDNLVNQKVALRILERLGYQADLAVNGQEVLEMLQRQFYDIVLMICTCLRWMALPQPVLFVRPFMRPFGHALLP
jgi:PleD family two-component response regulator